MKTLPQALCEHVKSRAGPAQAGATRPGSVRFENDEIELRSVSSCDSGPEEDVAEVVESCFLLKKRIIRIFGNNNRLGQTTEFRDRVSSTLNVVDTVMRLINSQYTVGTGREY